MMFVRKRKLEHLKAEKESLRRLNNKQEDALRDLHRRYSELRNYENRDLLEELLVERDRANKLSRELRMREQALLDAAQRITGFPVKRA